MTTSRLLALGTFVAALGAGLIAGAFFAFSSFVMRALAALHPPEGIRAMQSINVVVLNPVFLGTFMGTGVLCAALAVSSIVSWSTPGSGLRLVAALLYCVGCVGVTIAWNVPRNEALSAVASDSARGAELWARYVPEWTSWNTVRTLASLAACALLVLTTMTGCASFQNPETCREPAANEIAAMPDRLSKTGLYSDIGTKTVAEGVVPFRPRFPLWTDGADKERFVMLPRGAVIDASDMNAWQFPVGAKLWKEITKDGVRIETRLLQKTGPAPADWMAVAYVWDAAGRDAVAAPEGRTSAGGFAHDVPAASQCMGCHGGASGRVLGFSAMQLPSGGAAHDAREGDMTLARLEASLRLSQSPPPAAALVVPGDDTTKAALGYLHANCAHCHNAHRPAQDGPRCFDPRQDFDLSLRVGELGSPESTAVYRTGVGRIVRPGAPDDSKLLDRFETSGFLAPRMPALGTRSIDRDGDALLRRWISQLPSSRLAPAAR